MNYQRFYFLGHIVGYLLHELFCNILVQYPLHTVQVFTVHSEFN